jgi:hypothetical protein
MVQRFSNPQIKTIVFAVVVFSMAGDLSAR